MKNLRNVLMMLAICAAFASCRKNYEELAVPQEITQTVPAGEKMIYLGPHPGCVGALLFKRFNGQFLRAIGYPKNTLSLKVNDTVYVVYKVADIGKNDGIEFATPPVNISAVTPAKATGQSQSNNSPSHGKKD